VLFILNQFFHEMTKALVATNGHYSQFTGDGLMALYGLYEDDPTRGAADALRGAREMLAACESLLPADIAVMTAAVADFTPATPQEGKIKKAGRTALELELEPTADILAGLAAQRHDGQTLVGFAAEHGEGAIDGAREKLAAKHLDAIVVNDISREDIGFDADANEVTILGARGEAAEVERWHVPRAGKAQVAEAILDAVESLRDSR